jgi:HD-GYP domain-containing protein (c-di-GMP phosphodiesterase class II)
MTEETQFADRVDGRHETTCEGITSHGHYCVPIVSASKVLGVMNVYTQEGHPRADFEEAFLIAVANTLAGILERERSIERLRKALKATVEVMSAAVQMRDPYTASHQLRVTTVAGAIAGEMGVTDDSRHALQLAGQVHDLGKLRIPAEILTKPGRLTDTEFLLIKEHPQASYDLLKGIDFPGPVALIAYQHHERIDGSGYPQGLTGDEMLPEARILAVADVFEAMASHRPYRPALGVEGALHELERGRDTVYDRDAVDALIRLVRDKGFTLD